MAQRWNPPGRPVEPARLPGGTRPAARPAERPLRRELSTGWKGAPVGRCRNRFLRARPDLKVEISSSPLPGFVVDCGVNMAMGPEGFFSLDFFSLLSLLPFLFHSFFLSFFLSGFLAFFSVPFAHKKSRKKPGESAAPVF